MPLIRTNRLVAALVAALVAVPALPGPPPAGVRGAPEPPPVMLAILPRRTRVRRQWRYEAVRAIRAWLSRRLGAGSRPHGLHPRLPMRASYARGPPRAAA